MSNAMKNFVLSPDGQPFEVTAKHSTRDLIVIEIDGGHQLVFRAYGVALPPDSPQDLLSFDLAVTYCEAVQAIIEHYNYDVKDLVSHLRPPSKKLVEFTRRLQNCYMALTLGDK